MEDAFFSQLDGKVKECVKKYGSCGMRRCSQ